MEAFRAWEALNVQQPYMMAYSPSAAQAISSPTGLDEFFQRPDFPCSEKRDESLALLHISLSIAPSVIALLVCITRTVKLWGEVPKLQSRVWSFWKTAAWSLYGATQVALLIVWVTSHNGFCTLPAFAIASAALGICSAISFAFLSQLEHSRSVKPSTFICLFLVATAVLDTFLSLASAGTASVVLGASVVVKVLLLALEAQNKGKLLLPEWKQEGPEVTSGIFSRSFFWWLNSMMVRGHKTRIPISAFYALDRDLKSEQLLNRFLAIWKPKSDASRYSLIVPIIWTCRHAILRCVFPRLMMAALGLMQPVLLNNVIKYMGGKSDINEGMILILITAVIYIGYGLAEANFKHRQYRVETAVRGLISALVLHETPDLATSSQGSGAVTLLTTDINRIGVAVCQLMDIWAGVIEFIVALKMLSSEIGIGSLGPILAVIVSSALIPFVAKYLPPAQMKWNNATQHRISITTAIVSAMKEVKMLGAVTYWFEKIQKHMADEVAFSVIARNLTSCMNIIANLPGQTSAILAFTFAIYGTDLGTGDGFSLAKAFTSRSIIGILSRPLAMVLFAVPMIVRSLASIERFQNYLNAVEQSRQIRGETADKQPGFRQYTDAVGTYDAEQNDAAIVILKDAECRFKKEDEPILKNVNISIVSNSLNMIIGKVGTGKSVLLNSLLGELNMTGAVKLLKNVAYCSQTPWLFNSNIRKNIVGQSPMDDDWYNTVIEACGLDQDFAELADGDLSRIGSKGITLSGGQKHRVSLARALFSRKEVLVADDVLSGLDWKTQAHLWKAVFGPQGLLRAHQRTCILVTHCITWLEEADQIFFLAGDGTITQQGSYDALSQVEDFSSFVATRARDSSSNSSDDENDGEQQDAKPNGKRTVQPDTSGDKKAPQPDLSFRGDLSIYKYYFERIGWRYVVMAGIVGLVYPTFTVLGELYLKSWAERNERGEGVNNKRSLGIFSAITLTSFVGWDVDIWLFMVVISAKSVQHIHTALLTVLMKSRLSYFTNTDTGDTINRFSKDLGYMAIDLPYSFMVTWICVRGTIAWTTLVLPGSTYLIYTLPFTVVFIYLLQRFYLPISRQLRYHNLQSLAPINTHVLENIDGLATIRAYGWGDMYRENALVLMDESQKPHYLLICVQRWLSLILDMWVAAMAVLLVTLGVFAPEGSTKGFMAIALLGVVSMGSQISNLIAAWTDLETALGALGRVREFELTTPMEPVPENPQHLPEQWPEKGELEFINVTAAYSLEENAATVINDVSLTIQPGQKVAICGRTGSGKSSLLLTLFRMLESCTGRIAIDGIDIHALPPDEVRERLNAIPQEATLFPGSVRDNLWQSSGDDDDDNQQRPSDDAMRKALEAVELWELVSSQGGLDKEASELTLSQGQKQLVCLSRAVLRKHTSRILVLDEAMSAVDGNTEQVMVRILETEFSEHTVVSVAHRLNTVRKFDVVVVMDRGKIAEAGEPEELLKNRDGKFYSMWNSQ